MSKQIEVNLENCTACRICEFICSTHNFGEINPSKSRIKVKIISKDFFFFPVVCKQCSKAPCIEVCPKEALVRNQVSLVDEFFHIGAFHNFIPDRVWKGGSISRATRGERHKALHQNYTDGLPVAGLPFSCTIDHNDFSLFRFIFSDLALIRGNLSESVYKIFSKK